MGGAVGGYTKWEGLEEATQGGQGFRRRHKVGGGGGGCGGGSSIGGRAVVCRGSDEVYL